MKLRRRQDEAVSIAFLDVITCGFGAIILLLMIANTGKPPEPAPAEDDPRHARIGALSRELIALRAGLGADPAAATREALATRRAEQARLERELAAVEAANQARGADAARESAELGELAIAQQRLTEEMKRLYQQRNRARSDLVGGIPIDSEYIVFIIDTSGSMFRYAWSKVMQQITETLLVYPRVKGIQIMNDEGAYLFPAWRGQWMTDSAALRNSIVQALGGWNAFSNSSPAEGIYTAIRDFYRPDRRISLYVYGDEFTGPSIREVVDYVDRVNPKDARGRPLVRIHGVGFPVQFANPPHLQQTGIRFAALMREIARRNGGTFVGLNSFR